MARITFYTKIGCLTSAKQVDLLRLSGHDVEVCDLLAHDWSAAELRSYFGKMPVSAWFNDKSPRVKSGEIDPHAFDHEGALAVMMTDHLLIRRPLMESGGVRVCGFDPDSINAWIGLSEHARAAGAGQNYSSCTQPSTAVQVCP
ncbi:MAG TPA: arsenate reductase family protein [Desulfuromonadales bacterium]|nr:arsenate reductase family protein [Desulfuromonadales bacterium]